ncbi:MAG: hypothetical protein ABR502_06765 [Chitinophagaceae bacterium]
MNTTNNRLTDDNNSKENNLQNQQKEDLPENKIAVNPNPRANENIRDKDVSRDTSDSTIQVGSEITDGEAG